MTDGVESSTGSGTKTAREGPRRNVKQRRGYQGTDDRRSGKHHGMVQNGTENCERSNGSLGGPVPKPTLGSRNGPHACRAEAL